MAGLRPYHSMQSALNDGFQVHDKTHDGYLVRRYNVSITRWELAIVILNGRSEPTPLGRAPDLKTTPGHL